MRAAVLPSPTARSRAAAVSPGAHAPSAPGFHVSSPYPAAPRPSGTRPPPRPPPPTTPPANEGTGLGVRVPGRTGGGQLLASRAPPAAPIRGRGGRGGQGRRRGAGGLGWRDARRGEERGGGMLGTPRSGGAGAGGGRPGRALPSSCPRSGSKRSTGT